MPSNCTRQMPQTSSSDMSQRQEATAFHFLIVTFMVVLEEQGGFFGGKLRGFLGWEVERWFGF